MKTYGSIVVRYHAFLTCVLGGEIQSRLTCNSYCSPMSLHSVKSYNQKHLSVIWIALPVNKRYKAYLVTISYNAFEDQSNITYTET